MAILFDKRFASLTATDKLTYVDAGARGGLQGRWRDADDGRLRVVCFEPDAESAAALRGGSTGRIVIAKALWNTARDVELHLAQTPSTSSIHPPNWPLLERFRRQHAEPRRTVRNVTVACTTLDLAAAELGIAIDFVKIDTQGAEFEILEGAEQQLRQNVFAVACETWTQPVHSGQHVTHEVWALLDGMGFEVVQASIAAAWQHRVVDYIPVSGRAHLTGLDLLAFRRPNSWLPLSLARAAKWAAIAELYGYPDIALELLDTAKAVSNDERHLLAAFKESVRRSAGTEPPAELHY